MWLLGPVHFFYNSMVQFWLHTMTTLQLSRYTLLPTSIMSWVSIITVTEIQFYFLGLLLALLTIVYQNRDVLVPSSGHQFGPKKKSPIFLCFFFFFSTLTKLTVHLLFDKFHLLPGVPIMWYLMITFTCRNSLHPALVWMLWLICVYYNFIKTNCVQNDWTIGYFYHNYIYNISFHSPMGSWPILW